MIDLLIKRLAPIAYLRDTAGTTIFERGQAYARDGRVTSLLITEKLLHAEVLGNQLYQVKLWFKGKELQYSCSCPFAIEGAFCKHCVTVVLHVINIAKQ